LLPLACAVETQSQPIEYDEGDDTSMGGALPMAGTPPVSMAGTKPTAMGGSGAFGGTTSSGGGKAGSTSTGGKSSGGAGGSSAGDGGSSSAGKGGNASAGSASGGAANGGSPTNGCAGIKEWKGGDSTWTAAKDEVIQWKGKRYKVNIAIVYPNAECAPDMPVAWCANWWTADGSC
jgi:hypothetical protein